MRICLRYRCAGPGVSLVLFACALTWSTDSLASCGQHAGYSGTRQMTEVAHFEHASLIFGADSARDLVTPAGLAGLSCPGPDLPDSPPSVPSTSLRVQTWTPLVSAPLADPTSRPLTAIEDRCRVRVCRAAIDRPPRIFAAD